MRALLDTHVLLWWLSDDPHLTDEHRTVIAAADNEIYVSAVTVAEISIKASLGKLDAPSSILDALQVGGLTELALTAAHAELLRTLPWHHRDPFDRMLIAQATVERMPFLTVDRRITAYGIDVR